MCITILVPNCLWQFGTSQAALPSSKGERRHFLRRPTDAPASSGVPGPVTKDVENETAQRRRATLMVDILLPPLDLVTAKITDMLGEDVLVTEELSTNE